MIKVTATVHSANGCTAARIAVIIALTTPTSRGLIAKTDMWQEVFNRLIVTTRYNETTTTDTWLFRGICDSRDNQFVKAKQKVQR